MFPLGLCILLQQPYPAIIITATEEQDKKWVREREGERKKGNMISEITTKVLMGEEESMKRYEDPCSQKS